MAKRYYHDPVLTKPLPSTSVPFLVIVVLIVCMVLANKYFFGSPEKLLGGPPPRNEYLKYMHTPKPAPLAKPLATKAHPAVSPGAKTPATHSSMPPISHEKNTAESKPPTPAVEKTNLD
jgi:hypothetical protein